ncbi:MAG: hypothetical protein Q4G40_05350, partial [Brachybacterium sp.]|nr:hypothetical protein [Brachybacterium sp.]
MTRDSTRARNAAEDDDWIFAAADPGTLPTEELPDREAFDRHATPLLARPERPAQPVATRDHGTYARSGTTPSAEGAIELRGLTLPARFAELGFWDAARDLLALLCLIAAASTQFVVRDIGWWTVVPQSAIALSVLALVGVHCLRWIPRDPDLPTIRRLRVIGQIPAITVAVLIILADLVLSLPVLFSPLEQVPLGVGVGVSLLLVGAIVAIEPRRHEGWTPQEVSRRRMIAVLRGLGWAAAVLFALSLVMAVGRAFTTGWPFALTSFANSGLSALVLTVALASALQRDRSRFVFVTAAIGGLVIAALADNSLRMQFAAPLSVAIGFVYLPL